MSNIQSNKKESRNYKKAAILFLIGFGAFASHVFLAKGSGDFIEKLLHGDFIYMANLYMTMFVLGGWFLVYKFLGKLL